MSTIPTIEELKRIDTSHDLILSLTPSAEIIQFNKESERFTGYLRDEVLHKKFSELLIPAESVKQWNDLLDMIQKNIWIDNFVLPIITKDKQVYMITWTGFLVKTENGSVKDICIFGNPLKTEPIKKLEPFASESKPEQKKVEVQPEIPTPHLVQSSEPIPEQKKQELRPEIGPTITILPSEPTSEQKKLEAQSEIQIPLPVRSSEPTPEQKKQEKRPELQVPIATSHLEPVPEQQKLKILPETKISTPSPITEASPKQYVKEIPVKHGLNKLMFAHEKKIPDENLHSNESRKPIHPAEPEKSNVSVEPVDRQKDQTTQKLDIIHQSLSELLKKYEYVSERLEELEQKDQHEEDDHKVLDDFRKPTKENAIPPAKNQETVTPSTSDDDHQQSEEAKYSFLSDPFGFKRQHNELDLKKQQIELRMKALESFETRLMKEKDVFHARVEEFSKWQEKLRALESEIEKRRQELMKQEDSILEKRISSPVSQRNDLKRREIQPHIESDMPHCTDETLDKIPQSAAIIQRGILKQINAPFIELLGYTNEEIVEKSYFDFIALEGLADVEKYYLDRLKGDNIPQYRTVFATKTDIKIPVEVSIKQTIYNGEKAEIAIITRLNSHETSRM
jgi:PAS domain S-box-containing protein